MTRRHPSNAIVTVPRSGIRVVFDDAARYPDCIRLEVGEPSFDTPEHIKRAAHAAIDDNWTKYASNAGHPDLRAAIADKLRVRNGITATADDVIVANGGVAGIFTALASMANPGDEVLIPDPSWPNYVQMTLLLNARPVHYPLRLEHDLVPAVADIEALITDRTRVLVVNSPGNPSGAVIPRERLQELYDLARRHDLWVISDEVYDEIYVDEPPTSMRPIDHDDRVVSAFTFSKTYAMTGWRIGYIVGPESIISHILRAQEPTVSCINSISQRAALAALLGPQDCVAEMRAAYAARSRLVSSILDQHGLRYSTPRGAFYTMVDISPSGIDDLSFVRRLVAERRVAVAPGTAFGPESGRYVRVSLASDDDTLRNGVSRLAAAVGDWS
jgi:aspartate/methionine/tyrosine aminotransferase